MFVCSVCLRWWICERTNDRSNERVSVCVRACVYERAYLIYCLGKCSYLAQSLIRFVVRLCYCWCWWCCCCWFFFYCMWPFYVSVSLAQAPTSVFIHSDGILSLSLARGSRYSYAGSFASLDIHEPKIECVCVSSFFVYGLPTSIKRLHTRVFNLFHSSVCCYQLLSSL